VDDTKAMLGAIIKNARLNMSMSRKTLAATLGITPKHLMNIEHGKHRSGFDLLFNMVRELNIPGDAIFYPEEHCRQLKDFDRIKTNI